MRNEKICFSIWKFFVNCNLDKKKTILLLSLGCASLLSFSQPVLSPKKLKKLSIEELMNIQVTLVSRTPERLSEVASAIQVITGEDIHRSGATNIPEALRLVANLQVAQFNSSIWIISSRGFNTTFANKLLIMIDGRTVYTPLYGGVLWEQQYPLLEDIDRIEIVSGPGGTLWGANAVNGVINIVTKNSKQTQGLYAEAGIGNLLRDQVALRYGGTINDKIHYRLYAQHFNRDTTAQQNGASNHDAWKLTEAGFRLDWEPSEKEGVTVQGDYYWGNKKTFVGTTLQRSPINGQNIRARWRKTFSKNSDMSLQVYYDRYYRDDEPTVSRDKENTLDADLQHHFTIKDWHNIVWGIGYRYVKDDDYFGPGVFAGIYPQMKRLDLANAFVQDEVRLVDSLKLIAGTKLLHNVYTGWEWQPSLRLSWTKKNSTLWAAVSRAVRTPSRFDVDYYLPPPPQNPNTIHIFGDPNFLSEKVVAYELGYRLAPNHASFFSVSAFYNVYRDIYSVEFLPGSTVALEIQNGSEGNSVGLEFAGGYQISRNWRLRAGYTYFDKDLHQKPGHTFDPSYLGNDVKHQIVLQSISDITSHLQFDVVARYLSALEKTFSTPAVPAYFTFDARIAYDFRGFELSVVGQNLAQKQHLEYAGTEIPKNFFVKLAARF